MAPSARATPRASSSAAALDAPTTSTPARACSTTKRRAASARASPDGETTIWNEDADTTTREGGYTTGRRTKRRRARASGSRQGARLDDMRSRAILRFAESAVGTDLDDEVRHIVIGGVETALDRLTVTDRCRRARSPVGLAETLRRPNGQERRGDGEGALATALEPSGRTCPSSSTSWSARSPVPSTATERPPADAAARVNSAGLSPDARAWAGAPIGGRWWPGRRAGRRPPEL